MEQFKKNESSNIILLDTKISSYTYLQDYQNIIEKRNNNSGPLH